MPIEGRNFLVTGALGGIGSQITNELRARGARIFLASRAPARSGPPQSGVAHVTLDVTSESQWEGAIGAIVAEFGALHGLVNNAAYLGPATEFSDLSLAEWRRHTQVNLDGCFLGCRFGIRAMSRTGGGSIINISSGAAHIAIPDAAAYCVSKAALLTLTRLAAKAGAPGRVRVNAILPGAIDTPMLWRNLPIGMAPREFLATLEALHPLGRIGTPLDVAKAAAFLADTDNDFVTGAMLAVDGGQLVD